MRNKEIINKEIILNNQNINNIYQNIPKLVRKYKNKYHIKLICDKNIKEKEIETEIKEIIEAINIKDKRKRYNYIYNKVCQKLDNFNNNYCEFKNGICSKYRTLCSTHLNGCCENHKGEKCIYLSETGCTVKCFACKIYVCKHLKEKKPGIKKGFNDFPLINYFFNIEQKRILYFTFFTPQEEIIDMLLKIHFKK